VESAPIRAVKRLFGGGIDGNEQLTAMAGVLLIVLFAAVGVTIVRIGQLMWLHLFLGLLLLGPVLLKLASTVYRFSRYYLRAAIYVAKGPPAILLRAMGPALVLLTLVVFASGIVLLFDGPRRRATWLLIHKASFIAWLVLFGLHLIAHVPGLPRSLRAVRLGGDRSSAEAGHGGTAGRWLALAGMLVGGAVIAIVLIPHFSPWTAPGAFPHHEH
jgi:hypothetical protein